MTTIPIRQFAVTLTSVLAALSLCGCGETDSELFALRSGTPPSGGETLRLDEAGDILNGPLLGDCASACGASGFGASELIAGDLDADGFDDVLFALPTYREDFSRNSAGVLYVVYGRATWTDDATVEPDAIIEMDGLDGTNDFKLARAGDVDGDGYADFLVGDKRTGVCGKEGLEPGSGDDVPGDAGFGRAYLAYGGPGRLSGAVAIADVASTFVDDTPCVGLGAAVSSAGDVDGDGFDDFVLGGDPNRASPDYPEDRVGEGRAYVFHGSAERRPATSSVSTADATLRGRSDMGGFGLGLARAGDVDGDGDSDFLVAEAQDVIDSVNGEPVPHDAATYLVAGGDRLVGEVDATASSRITIFSGRGLSGLRTTGLGDLDEDGLEDFVLDGWGGSISDGVEQFIFYGRADGFGSSVSVSTADIRLSRPLDQNDHSPPAPSAAAGDHDGDGHRDIILGGDLAAGLHGGASVISGTGARWTGDFLIDDIATSYVGSEPPPFPAPMGTEDKPGFEQAGLSVAGDGDVDGDGTADLLVGAPGTGLGRTYLLRRPDPGASGD